MIYRNRIKNKNTATANTASKPGGFIVGVTIDVGVGASVGVGIGVTG